jgi:replicative DNA helicase
MEFNKLSQQIKENYARKHNCIPFNLNRVKDYIPGISRREYTIITANSGIGKSKFARGVYIYDALDFIIDNEEFTDPVKMFYFSLEESEIKFILSYVARKLKINHGIETSVRDLLSMYEKRIGEDVLPLIDLYGEEFSKYSKYLEVVDFIHTPTGIYNHVYKWLDSNGTMLKEKVGDMNITKEYVPNNKYQYCIIVVDQLNLLDESNKTTKEAMEIFSMKKAIKLRNVFNCSIIALQQQAADKEKQIYTQDGASVESKLEPSLDGLGDSKLTQRDADIVLGLFAPDRYGITMHPAKNGFDIKKLGDTYRSLKVLKDRNGSPNLRFPLSFDGQAEIFRTLEKPNSPLTMPLQL